MFIDKIHVVKEMIPTPEYNNKVFPLTPAVSIWTPRSHPLPFRPVPVSPSLARRSVSTLIAESPSPACSASIASIVGFSTLSHAIDISEPNIHGAAMAFVVVKALAEASAAVSRAEKCCKDDEKVHGCRQAVSFSGAEDHKQERLTSCLLQVFQVFDVLELSC